LLDRLEVPAAQSRPSNIATVRPRVTASSATPAPTTPPPTTTTSSSSTWAASSAAWRSAGPNVLEAGNGPVGVWRMRLLAVVRRPS
jgi:hypothetical protein